jgi:phage terminase large subunit-like protein
MASLGALADRVVDGARRRIRPPFLKAIGDWRKSDCQSPDPDKHPTAQLAAAWVGHGKLCPQHEEIGCRRCHSCSSCRPEQRIPVGDWWDDWLYLAGRGAGKTRSAAEEIAAALALNTRWRAAIVAPTYADARDTCVEGESGILAVFDRWGWLEDRDYTWNRSLGELLITSTRSRAKLYSAETPARLRGPQHHIAWVEELAQVIKRVPDAWDMLKFGLRLGKHPRVLATTTPLPLQMIRDMIADPQCAVSRGATDDNAANLPPVALRALHKKYDGTRTGRQELGGEILDDVEGALWKRVWLDEERVVVQTSAKWAEDHPEDTRAAAQAILAELAALGIIITRTVVAVDPAVTSGEDADRTGIVVAGRADDGRFYVLADYTLRETPDIVMATLVQAYDDWEANAVIVETNNGGEYIPGMLHLTCEITGHSAISTHTIHAKKGKRVRAEPVSAIYGQRRARHVGTHTMLEDLLCVWTPEDVESPDEMDALVYAILWLDGQGTGSDLLTAKASIPRHVMGRGTGRPTIPTSSTRSRRG